MVSTIKFSEFAATVPSAPNNVNVGLSNGVNSQSPVTVTWTTATRPATPYNGLLGYNTDLSDYEYWNAHATDWVELGSGGGGGSVTIVNTGLGLTGGPITSTGTISFTAIAANSFWANTTGSFGLPAVTSLATFLLSANNLSDLTNASTARTNLGLAIGVNVQAYSAALTSLAAVSGVANAVPYFTSPTTYSVIAPLANSVLVTSAGSVPSLSTTLPTAVQSNITQLGTQSQAFSMGGFNITNLANPINPQDAATKAYVTSVGGSFLPLAGGTMLGVINMGGFNITNMANPINPQDAVTKAYLTSSVTGYLPLSGGTMTGAINMGTFGINSLANPVNPQDAVTLSYLTTTAGAYLPLAGGTMAGVINMGNFKISNMADPTLAKDAVNIEYLNAQLALYLLLTGGTMSGILNMGSHQISNITDPTHAQDAVTLNYLNTTAATFLPLLGGTMQGAINMGNFKIDNMADPTLAKDAVNLEYLNTQLGFYLPLAGGTMGGPINMNSNKIVGLGTPTNGTDAATKAYVDSFAAGLSVKPAAYASTTANLAGYTYLNGSSGIGATLTAGSNAVFTTDGTTPATNAEILVQFQTTTFQNGIYTLTQTGSAILPAILTRATFYNQPSQINPGDLIIINNGTLYAGTSFVQTDTVTAVGTDPIQFSQFTFSSTQVLLKANNLSDVANTVTSFNNISPLTTKGDLIGYSTGNIRIPVGTTNGMMLQVASGATPGVAWSTATYPVTTTANQLLYSSATNTIAGLTSNAGGVLVTDASSVPQLLTNPGAAGRVLQSGNSSIATWSTPTYPSASGASGKFLISDGTNNVYSTSTIPTSAGVTAGKALVSDGTNYVLSSAAFPASVGAVGTILRSDGTNWVATTTTYPNTNAINTLVYASAANVLSALATANSGVLVTSSTGVPSVLAAGTTGQVLQASTAGTPAWSTPTYPSASGASGLFLISNGTNNVYSTSTIPTSAGAVAGKVLTSDGTNYVLSTTTFPSTSGAAGTLLISNGTNIVNTTSTYPTTNAINTLLYASAANVMSALATANSGVLVTSGSGVPSILSAGTTGQVLQASTSGTASWSTPTYPSASGTSGKFLISDGTNIGYSTSTIPTSAGATANKLLLSNGTNYVLSTPTFPNASSAAGIIMVSDGTNWIASTPTFPNASATARKIIVSDGTNWVASTETYAVPGTSGNVLTSNGTNWISSPSTGTGTVSSGLINQLAYYAAAGTTVSGVTIVNSAVLTTTAGGVPTWVASTGSGSPVLATSPTLVTPTLGAATATSITFSPTTNGIVGTTTNDNASAGYVGEFMSASNVSGSPITFSTGVAKTLQTITLSAGDWDVWGNIDWAGTTITNGAVGLNTATNTLPDSSLFTYVSPLATSVNIGLVAPQRRFTVATTQAVYLVGNVSGTGTLNGSGGIYARRAR